jgi:predicted Zn-dependent peptidase
MPDVRSVTLGVWLRQGSRHETPAINGISHFLEHLVFKGTETRTARDIALAMESVGGQMDAFTSKEYTCFYTKVLDQHVPEALDLLADIVRRPKFDPVELERERRVILEEIRMVLDTPDELIYDLFSEHFWPRHALGRPIQGTADTVGRMGRPRLQRFFRGAYRPGNVVIAAAGNIDPTDLGRRVRRMFGDMEPAPAPALPTRPPRPRGGIVRRSKPLEQTHLLLGVPGYPKSVEHRYVLSVLNSLLGGTMSSRLFQKIREERGLAYSVYSGINSFVDAGFLMVYAATAPSQAAETVRLVLAELDALARHGPTADEVAIAREHLKGSLMLSLESTSSRMSNLAQQEIYYGRQFRLEEILKGIDRVTPGRVHAICREIFSGTRASLAVVGRTARFRMREEELQL